MQNLRKLTGFILLSNSSPRSELAGQKWAAKRGRVEQRRSGVVDVFSF